MLTAPAGASARAAAPACCCSCTIGAARMPAAPSVKRGTAGPQQRPHELPDRLRRRATAALRAVAEQGAPTVRMWTAEEKARREPSASRNRVTSCRAPPACERGAGAELRGAARAHAPRVQGSLGGRDALRRREPRVTVMQER